MTSVKYDDIFSSFLGYIEDSKFALLDDDSANLLMYEYLQKALAKPHVKYLFSSIEFNNETNCIDYNIKNSLSEDSDIDFVVDLLSKGMVVEWLQPIVKRTSLLKQMITSSKESRFFSQSQHLSEMRGLLEDTKNEVSAMIRDRGYLHNDYLGGSNDEI